MARKHTIPEVNAGSMADIAFLLLIFFLVTATIQTDVGLDQKIPPKNDDTAVIKENNLFRISINKRNEIFLKNKVVPITELKDLASAFIDNAAQKESCSYCKGSNDPNLSDSPKKAIFLLNSDREAKYATYVNVQNELERAYNELRNREANRLYQTSYVEMENRYYKPETSVTDKQILKKKIEHIRGLYPHKIIETETKY